MASFVVFGFLFAINNAAMPTYKLQNAASADSLIPAVGLGCAIPVAANEQYTVGFESATKWLSVGGRLIDEAYCYPSREGVAAGVLNYTNNYSIIPRSDLFIQSKVGGCSGDHMGYNPVMEQIQNELKLWNTDYLDSVLIHWCSDNDHSNASPDPTCNSPNITYFNATLCRQHTWQALIELFLNGTVKAIGVSNFEIKHLNDLINYKYENKAYLPAINQMQFHGYWHEYNLLNFCNQHNILYNSWSTLGAPDVEANQWTGNTPVLIKHPIAIGIGNKYNKTAAQVWLRWQYQLKILVIPRSNNKTHMTQNMDIFDFELSNDDMQQLYNVTAPPYPQNLVYLDNANNPQNLP